MNNNANISNEIQQAVDVISQYASENWNEMGVNYHCNQAKDFIDAYVSVDGDEYSISFDDEDNTKLKEIFVKIQKKSGETCNIISLEFDNDGNYEIEFEQ